jgi:ABC-type oligopeptide transport system ATPase subunit
VGLRAEHDEHFPDMFSGGQYIAVARTLMLQLRVVVLDEPVSEFDLSVQAQVLNLLADLQGNSASLTGGSIMDYRSFSASPTKSW